MKEHTPLPRKSFKGLWTPSNSKSIFEDDESAPRDHLLICDNCDFTFDGLVNRSPFVAVPDFGIPFNTLEIPRRVHVIDNIPTQNGDLLIGTASGSLYYYDGTSSGVLLDTHAAGGTIDFNFLPWIDRIYIIYNSFFGFDAPPTTQGPMKIYDAGLGFRNAGQGQPGSSATIAPLAGGVIAAGVHFFGVSFETDTGFISRPTATNPVFLDMIGTDQVAFSNIPVFGTAKVVARWLIATKTIPVRVPNDSLASYPSFFAVRIPDNVTTTFNLNFRDTELLRDSSYLFDIYQNPPHGTSISSYHNRLCITAPSTATVADRHVVIISKFGEPETFDQVDGVIEVAPTTQTVVTLPGPVAVSTGLTDSQVYRDVLYLTKIDSTYSVADNGDEPSFWPGATVDQTIGARPNGIVPVKNPGSESVDYLLITHTTGIYLFTGLYRRPEITWKVKRTFEIPLEIDLTDVGTRLRLVNNFKIRKVYIATSNPVQPLPTLAVMDYNQISPDLQNYHMDVKYSLWKTSSLENMFAFQTLFLRNGFLNTIQFGTGIVCQSGEFSGADLPLDSVIPLIIFPSDRDGDDKMIHLKSIRLKINRFIAGLAGDVEVEGFDFNSLGLNSIFDKTISLSNNLLIEPTITANVLGQRIAYQLLFTDHAVFNLLKFISYIKPVYSTLPYQYVP